MKTRFYAYAHDAVAFSLNKLLPATVCLFVSEKFVQYDWFCNLYEARWMDADTVHTLAFIHT